MINQDFFHYFSQVEQEEECDSFDSLALSRNYKQNRRVLKGKSMPYDPHHLQACEYQINSFFIQIIPLLFHFIHFAT